VAEELPLEDDSYNLRDAMLADLAKIAPALISEGKLNLSAFANIFGENDNSETERYQLSWKGKSEAYKTLQTTTASTLKPCIETSVNWETSKNLFIEGENLEVLKVLQRSYFGKVRLLYVDPPYNTGSDSFIYPDKFAETKEEYLARIGAKDETGQLIKEGLFKPNTKENGHFHSNWLSMMLPRIFLARNLLREDGIFVTSIDDHEAYSLKLLLDEIFGEENFAGNIVWNSTKSVTNTALLSVSHTHNLVYFRDIEYHKKNRYEFRLPDSIDGFSNPDNDPRGPWKADPFQVGGERPNQLYEIMNPNTGQTYVPNPGSSWKNDFTRFEELMADNRIVFGVSGEAGPQRKRFWSEAQERGRVTKSLWTDLDTTSNATSYLVELMGKGVFTNPKPVDLIQRFIQLGTLGKDEIVMDFFGGSGTTAEAVLKQNAEDGGNRQFVFVTLPEALDNKTQAGKNALALGFTTIADVARARISKAIDLLNHNSKTSQDLFSSHPRSDSDLGFRHFELTRSNFKNWRGDVATNVKELTRQLELTNNSEFGSTNEIDLAIELILKDGLDLGSSITRVALGDSHGYLIGDNAMLLITKGLSEKGIQKIIDLAPKSAIFLDSMFAGNDAKKTNIRLQLAAAGIEFRSL